jgi:hypothetical protein
MSKVIVLNDGQCAEVDDEDFRWLGAYGTWSFYKRGGYAYTRVRISPGNGPGCVKHVAMHRAIAIHHGIIPDDPNVIVDHINRDRLDNQKSNFRAADQTQNSANRSKQSVKATSQYKGVSYDKNRNQYRAYIRVDGKMVHLGYHKDEKVAARKYNAAAKEAFGDFAHLNEV